MKFVFCVRRNPGMTAEQFRVHWRDVHAPLVRMCASKLGMRRYVQTTVLNGPVNDYIQSTRGGQEPFDGIAELWWDTEEDLAAALSTPEGQEADRLLMEDGHKFIDLANSVCFASEELEVNLTD